MPKDSSVPYDQLSIYDRTFIENTQAIVANGKYSPGELVMDLAKDLTDAMMTELGFSLPSGTPARGSYEWRVWGPQAR